MLNSSEIKKAALDVGFDDCGIARANALTDEEYPLREWLRRGWHGDLQYMERNADKRMDPRLLVPGARSVICCVSAYPPPENNQNTPIIQNTPNTPKIAAYAQHREYHNDIKAMLFALGDRLSKMQNSKFEIRNSKFCCDTVPISDKHWAARAGLGWIGRHTLLVTPRWGSWVNLGEIVTTEECSEYSEYSDYSENSAHSDFCSKCNRCVAACPNQAIKPLTPAPSVPSLREGWPEAGVCSERGGRRPGCVLNSQFCIDVTRCTAYYTTHHSRPLPPDIDTRGYTQGCDLCQLACPFNQR